MPALLRLARRLPASWRSAVRLAIAFLRITADRRSFRTYLRLRSYTEHRGAAGRTVRMRIRSLGDRPVTLRPSTSDIDTVWGTFAREHHRPPRELGGDVEWIWDLGANIGLTVAHLATLFPAARIVGVELDAENVALARANVEPWGDRCEVLEAAVWSTDGRVWYHRLAGATAGHRVAGSQPLHRALPAPAISLNSLLARSGAASGPRIDYVKVDVEGAERELLRANTEWAESVRCIKVEVHAPYTAAECAADLRRLGFSARPDDRHHAAVIGMRDGGEGTR